MPGSYRRDAQAMSVQWWGPTTGLRNRYFFCGHAVRFADIGYRINGKSACSVCGRNPDSRNPVFASRNFVPTASGTWDDAQCNRRRVVKANKLVRFSGVANGLLLPGIHPFNRPSWVDTSPLVRSPFTACASMQSFIKPAAYMTSTCVSGAGKHRDTARSGLRAVVKLCIRYQSASAVSGLWAGSRLRVRVDRVSLLDVRVRGPVWRRRYATIRGADTGWARRDVPRRRLLRCWCPHRA